ncbi:aspartate carbamoyltransferase [Clostridia bacterium]|nr:aspartate carbamoyltransferase [Clostridia bacterium]
MRHLITTKDLSANYIDCLIDSAKEILRYPRAVANDCDGKILAALFYESSTRTRLSFETAMLRLGGKVIGFESAASSSATKGESVADTIRIVSSYADIAVIRHPKEGAALIASMYSSVPVINAGDGGHQHPTQTLTDLLTISKVKGRLCNLTIGFCGDLKFGRTVHSLLEACLKYSGNKYILVSPDELKIPEYIREDLRAEGVEFTETNSLSKNIADMDILYMTRVQRERFFNEEDYVRLKDAYILNKQKLAKAKPDLAVLHPLPRVNEIATEIDKDPRALYFKQAEYGAYVRMALIKDLFREED